MSQQVHCEVCGKESLRRVGIRPVGVLLWACSSCGDGKRWCPRCDQGWVRRFRVTGLENDIYSCDECEATWDNPLHLHPPGTDRKTFLDTRLRHWTDADLSTIRESAHDLEGG
jgi:ribosomal protein L37AE/L43A